MGPLLLSVLVKRRVRVLAPWSMRPIDPMLNGPLFGRGGSKGLGRSTRVLML